MPLDPRIPLMADQIVLPDRLAGQERRQKVQANRMAMEAQTNAAQRNAMARRAALGVDFTDPVAATNFGAEYGEDATPFIENAGRVQTMRTAQSAEARAAEEEQRKQREAGLGIIGPALVGIMADPSDANMEATRQRLVSVGIPEDQITPIMAQFMAVPVEQRGGAVRQFAMSNEAAREALEFVSPKPVEVNLGDRVAFIDANPNSPTYNQEVRSDAVGINPNQPVQIVQGAAGAYALPRGGEGEAVPVTSGGAPIGLPPTAAQQTAAAGGGGAQTPQQQRGLAALNTTLDTLAENYTALGEEGAMVSSTRQSPLENIGAAARASGVGRMVEGALGTQAQTRRNNITNTRPLIIAALKEATGMSAQQLNSNVELQLYLNTLSDPSQSVESALAAVEGLRTFVTTLMGGDSGGASSGAAPQRIYSPEGVPYVVRNGQWVPE